MAITVQTLLDAGYHKFHDRFTSEKMGHWYHGSYQRRVCDNFGTKYFITINHNIVPELQNDNDSDNKGFVFNIELMSSDHSLKAMEDWVERLWTTMKLDYYENSIKSRHTPQSEITA
jgi:hypothetical protein